MADARADAIAHLAQLVPEAADPIVRIILSRQFRVFEWFVPAVNVLARRASPVGVADVQRLSVLGDPLELALKLSWVRESFTGQQSARSLVDSGPVATPQVQNRQGLLGFPLARGDCGYHFLCTTHEVVTNCVGEGCARDVNGERRAAHDSPRPSARSSSVHLTDGRNRANGGVERHRTKKKNACDRI
jgi:hypothetical protein